MKKVKVLKTIYLYHTNQPLVVEGKVYDVYRVNSRFAYTKWNNCELRLTLNKDCVII